MDVIAFDLPLAPLLAVVAGLVEAIAVAGTYIGAVPVIVVARTISPLTDLPTLGFTVVLHLVESSVLVPRVVEQAVGPTPLTIALALLA